MSPRYRLASSRLLIEPESNFSNVLLIRQVLGHGVLKETKPNQADLKKELEERVGNMLSLLFPEGKNLKKKFKDFVDRAVDLANLMTEEKCLFFCDMVSLGQSCNLDEMHPYDEEEGLVKMCMFPVFGLKVRNENGAAERKVLVKAEVELERLMEFGYNI